MDWANESYVRIYRRKTTTAHLLGWEGNAVMRMLITELDRSGYLELDGLTPAEAAAVHTGMPLDLVQVGMERLLSRGVLVVEDGRLFSPNYFEAQTTPKSENQRKREQRERDAAARAEVMNVTNRDRSPGEAPAAGLVTNGDNVESRTVTNGSQGVPPPSQKVTLSLIPDPVPDQKEIRPAPPNRDLVADRVFQHWVSVMAKPKAKLTPQRRSKVKARLRDGYTAEQLIQAVDGCRLSAFHMGENDRGQPYNDLDTILKDGKSVESHIARLETGGKRATDPVPLSRKVLA